MAVTLCHSKRINRILGTEVGNQALIQMAQMLQLADKNTMVFCGSGKHFMLIRPSIFEYESTQQEILEIFSQPMEINGNSISSPVSVCGIIHAEQLGDCGFLLGYLDFPSPLVSSTTRAVLIQGDEKILQGFRYTQEVEHYFQASLEQDLFEVYFQPVYSAAQKRYVTMEALSRLHHPTLGPVPPEVFIGIAEKSDQIAQPDL